jgi:hypothetical protein
VITLEDCLGLCDLSEEEILAIAEHDHLPEIAAIAKGQYLLAQTDGTRTIFSMIVDDIRRAQAEGDKDHVVALLHVLHHFIRAHPETAPKEHPWSQVL